MTASGASTADGKSQPAARAEATAVSACPDGTEGQLHQGQNGTAATAEPGSDAVRPEVIEWLAEQTVPRLAPTALVSVFSPNAAHQDHRLHQPTHYLIQLKDASARTPMVTPVISPALDMYAPFARIADGSGQLWLIDGTLSQIFALGTSAIAVPFGLGNSEPATLTLLRSPDATPFALEDLMTLEALVAQIPNPGLNGDQAMAMSERSWQTALLTPSDHVDTLRDLMRDLTDGDTPYDVARRLAGAAQEFFAATSCVVYLVDPARPTRDNRTPPSYTHSTPGGTATRSGLALYLPLQLAGSVGSGVLLTPPWLEPAETADAGTLFASTADGTVLMADFEGGSPWVEQTVNDELLVALPLKADGELVAILGMRSPGKLPEMQSITVENFALIGANALLVSRRREADRSSILTLRSELARSRLAHDATIAMFGSSDIMSGLIAHASLLVPGIADGYLVYRIPQPSSGVMTGRTNGTSSERIFSHWRAHEDMAAESRFESWIDRRLAHALSDARSGGELPLLLSDVEVEVEVGPNPDGPGPNSATTPAPAIRSLAAVPLVRNGETFGALVLVATEHVRRYGQRDFALIASLAEPVARLLSAGAFSPEGLDQAAPARPVVAPMSADAVLLADLAPKFIGAVEIDEITRLSAEALANNFGGWCVVDLLDNGSQGTMTTGAHADPTHDWPRELWAGLSQNRDAPRGPANVLRNGQSDLSMIIDWVIPVPSQDQDQSQDEPALCPALIPASSISAPMVSGTGVVIGAISCFRSQPSPAFTLADLATLELVAEITGDAIAAAQQRQSEREVGAQQQWLGEQRTQLIAQLADAVIVIDQRKRIIFANFQARQLHGVVDLPATADDYLVTFQPREIGGLLFTAATFPLTVALSTETKQRGVWRLRTAADLEVTVVAAVNPLRADDGSINGAVLSLHDATEHFAQERIHQRHLIEISDELRSPIASIKGWSQYLTQRIQTPGETTPDSRAVDAIAKQTRLLQQLVERLVTASQSARVDDTLAQPRQVDVRDLLGQLIHTQQTKSPNRTIALSTPDERPIVGRWDSAVIGQIFEALLANAIRSGPDGSPTEITVERRPGRVAVSITDHGPGISSDQQQSIFERQAGSESGPTTEAAVVSPTGRDDSIPAYFAPDLHAVARLVTRLNGQISLHSTVGMGSTFTVQLPIDQ